MTDLSAGYGIESIDLSQETPPSVEELWENWWLIHAGTQSTIEPYGTAGKQWRAIDWSWLIWNNIGYGVPFMLIGCGKTNLIPKS